VHWLSWHLPFVLVSFVNAFFGAIAAQTLPAHAFESIYFGRVFASLFFLQLALAPGSFFVAALCRTAKKAAIWLVLLLLIFLWIPKIVVGVQLHAPSNDTCMRAMSPVSLLRQNAHTHSCSLLNHSDPGADATQCSVPIMSEFQGTLCEMGTKRELVRDDECHVGCHFLACWTSET
jgi:hypothetical protein